jgi:low affinity Fe/Cu permease
VPKAISTSVIAHAATAPAMMEGQDTPVTGEPADPPGATTTVSIMSFAPKMKAPRTFRRNNEHLDGLFLTHGTFGGSSDLLPVETGATFMKEKETVKEKAKEPSGVSKFFGDMANKTSLAAGRASTFMIAAGIVILWAVSGPLFGFSDTWQLVINTGTTIVTFLMVFLIQNSQNRDSAAIQVKLDELIRVGAARNSLIGIEHLTDDEIEDLRGKCEARARAEKSADNTLDKTRKSARRAAEKVAN